MHILVTGGAGYIGSHTVVELLNHGHDVTVADNLVNSSSVSLDRIMQITGKRPAFIDIDVTNLAELKKVFAENSFDAVIHFAALKSVSESVSHPLRYYVNNVIGMLNVLESMEAHHVNRLIFSSSATVYGVPEQIPLLESSRVGVGITNPYGHTKVMCEQILTDYAKVNKDFKVTLLRYFNPAGAHESGLIGEDPNDIPNNLIPYISQVAVGRRSRLSVFGGDYETKDGTGVRDYIHVTDLARAHLQSFEHTPSDGAADVYNIGTGQGYSVLEIIQTFEKASGKKIPFEITDRRAGDIAVCYADPKKAMREIKWKAKKTLEQMCEDSWRWQSQNPTGYKS